MYADDNARPGARATHLRTALVSVIVTLAALAPATVSGQDASPSAMPTAVGLDLCWDPELGRGQEPCPLPAGHYSPSLFEPAIAFDLDAGWANYRSYPDGFALVGPDTPFDVSVMRGVRRGFDGQAEVDIDEGMAGMVTYLADNPALELVTTEETTVGGLPATVLDLDAPAGAPLFTLESDGYGASPGDRLRAWVIDHPDGTITIVGEVYAKEGADAASQEDIETLMTRLKPFIASVTFQGVEGA